MDISYRKGESPTSHSLFVGRDLTLAVSYQTVIGFAVSGFGWLASENVWGPTTGKHLNQLTPVDRADRLPREEFEAKLASVMDCLTFDRDRAAMRLHGLPERPADPEKVLAYLEAP